MTPEVDARLLEVLICPQSRTALRFDRDKRELVSASAQLAYPVHDGVPIMAADDARELSPDE